MPFLNCQSLWEEKMWLLVPWPAAAADLRGPAPLRCLMFSAWRRWSTTSGSKLFIISHGILWAIGVEAPKGNNTGQRSCSVLFFVPLHKNVESCLPLSSVLHSVAFLLWGLLLGLPLFSSTASFLLYKSVDTQTVILKLTLSFVFKAQVSHSVEVWTAVNKRSVLSTATLDWGLFMGVCCLFGRSSCTVLLFVCFIHYSLKWTCHTLIWTNVLDENEKLKEKKKVYRLRLHSKVSSL